ncbi:hypothetical protein THAOC_16023, partial [Thalassiosira oceanica]
MLIIRDPPGGESSVTYSHVKTTVTVSMEEMNVYRGMSYSLGGGFDFEGGGDAGVCFGGGVHAETTEMSGSLGTHFEHEKMKDVSTRDSTHSHQTSVVWSYSTSGEPEYAGKFSDSFLLNTLVIIFRVTRTILFDEATCTASEGPITTTFDVGSQENRKPLSF